MRLLLVSRDTHWMQHLQLRFEPRGIHATTLRLPEDLVAFDEAAGRAKAQAGGFDGALLGVAPEVGSGEDTYIVSVLELIDCLRKTLDTDARILLWPSYTVQRTTERLGRLCRNDARVSLLPSDDPAAITGVLAPPNGPPSDTPRWATVEVEVGAAEIRVRVAVEGQGVLLDLPRTWSGRPKLKRLEEKFRVWSLWQKATSPPRYTDFWLDTFREAGQDLADELEYQAERLQGELACCRERLGAIDNIHFRFNLLTANANEPPLFAHVPFELLYDTSKVDFLRALAPVARRIHLHRYARIAESPARDAATQPLTGPVLFVASDAHGAHLAQGATFNRGQPTLALKPLRKLAQERDAMRAAWSGAEETPFLEPVALTFGGDALGRLRDALLAPATGAPRPQILHFAGHSVRADSGSVHLVLPGADPGQLRLVAMRDVAAWVRQSGVRLVILSSCESTSPDSVFRLAQEGVPAVIGFRWEVNDCEAAFFTGRLHAGLAGAGPDGKKMSLARTFHAAVMDVRREFLDSPTFASPMLVVQDDVWTL